MYKPIAELLICGDINRDYLIEINQKKKKLTSFLTTYNLSHAVKFATRIQNNLSTATNNTFVDNSSINLSFTTPIINDAQILTIKNIYATINKFPFKQKTRYINNETIMNFQTLLKNKPGNLFI